MDIAGVDVEIDVIRELPELEDLEVNSSTKDQSFNSSKYGFKNVTIKGIKGEKLDLNPSLEQQNYEGVFLGVNINPIQVEEIETDLDFSSGDAIELKAQEGAYIKKATINKDANLTPENIKSGVSIAGISGEVADTSDADATSDDIISGKTAYVANEKIAGTFVPLDTSDATATAEDIAKDKTAYVNGEKVVGTLEASGDYNAKIKVFTPATFIAGQCIQVMDFTNVDTSSITYMDKPFNSTFHLEKIIGLHFPDATNLNSLLYQHSYIKSVEITSAPKVTSMGQTFMQNVNSKLEQIIVDKFDTSKVVNFYRTFYSCVKLQSLSAMDMSSATNINETFYSCKLLKNLGGLINVGKNFTTTTANNTNYTLNLSASIELTHESLMNVINGLYDLNLTYDVANGGTLYTQQLVLGDTNLAKLTAEEIAIATKKGWTVS